MGATQSAVTSAEIDNALERLSEARSAHDNAFLHADQATREAAERTVEEEYAEVAFRRCMQQHLHCTDLKHAWYRAREAAYTANEEYREAWRVHGKLKKLREQCRESLVHLQGRRGWTPEPRFAFDW